MEGLHEGPRKHERSGRSARVSPSAVVKSRTLGKENASRPDRPVKKWWLPVMTRMMTIDCETKPNQNTHITLDRLIINTVNVTTAEMSVSATHS